MGTLLQIRRSAHPELTAVAVVALAHPERLWGEDGAERLAALDALWLTADGLVARAALHAVRIGFPTVDAALTWAKGAYRAMADRGDALRGAVVAGRPELREDPLTGRADLVGAPVLAGLRLAELAAPGELLVDAEVAGATPGAARAAGGWSVRWAAPVSVVSALPAPAGPFVGRAAEVAAVDRASRASPVVQLAGPPGVGKSRLALELARARGGAVWVDLGPARTAADVVIALGAALGVPLGADANPAAALDRLARVVAARPDPWVVLDDADGADGVADAARALGSVARVVVTARSDLGCGEGVTLGGLALEHAVELLRRPGWTDADERDALAIARAVDGSPLALHLAAAAFDLLRPGQVLARLDAWVDLGAAVRWAAGRLTDDARRVLSALAVFPGAFGPDAIDGVVDLPPGPAWAAVRALVDASLVRRVDGGRFTLPEPVRRVAAGWLDAGADAEAARERHARWVLREVPGWWSGEGAVLTPERDARLRDEWADLVALVERSPAHAGWAAAALDVVAATRAPVSTRLGWLDRGIAAAAEPSPLDQPVGPLRFEKA
ncbi:MAG: ATP-binding protein, partial [Myxococcota bacterium]